MKISILKSLLSSLAAGRFLPYLTAAILFVLPALPCANHAAAGEIEAKVKAAYIYNFTLFTDWSADGNEALTDPINICVFGTDTIGGLLEELSDRMVKGRPLKVLRLKEISKNNKCHVFFISRSEEQRLPLILQKLHGANVLTVSDIPRFSQRGGVIGFMIESERVRIEINLRAAREAGLKFSAKLMEIARIVQ
jgi:hypothetical protein